VRGLVASVAALLVAAGGIGAACQNPPAPSPTPAQSVYGELVDAGCLAPSDSGAYWVAQEIAMQNPPSWVTCLADGGRILACGVPCTRTAP
jgi:hypothetical protein